RSAARGSGCAGSGFSRSSRGSVASGAIRAPARKSGSRRGGPSDSSPAKICRISGKLDPVPLDTSLSPRVADLGAESLLPPPYGWRPRPKYQDRVWLHLLLFLL